MRAHFKRLAREDHGQDLIEYALLAALISVACVGAITATGTSVTGLFTTISTGVSTAAGAAS